MCNLEPQIALSPPPPPEKMTSFQSKHIGLKYLLRLAWTGQNNHAVCANYNRNNTIKKDSLTVFFNNVQWPLI